jgi:hypothetical protein
MEAIINRHIKLAKELEHTNKAQSEYHAYMAMQLQMSGK